MTTYKTVVSWLVLLFLGWRGVVLVWRILSVFYTDGLSGDLYPEIREGLWWSPLWVFSAWLIAAPWVRRMKVFYKWEWLASGIDEIKAEHLNLAGRWAFVFLIVLTPGFVSRSHYDVGFFGSVSDTVVLGIFLVCCVAPELTQLASSGFTGFIDAVFFPGGRESKPPYTMKLARFYVEKRRYEEAEVEYARMLSFYPEQVEAWQERIALAFQRTDEADPAPEEILAASLKALRKEEDREAVHRIFAQHRG